MEEWMSLNVGHLAGLAATALLLGASLSMFLAVPIKGRPAPTPPFRPKTSLKEMEALLYQADLGPRIVSEALALLKKEGGTGKDPEDILTPFFKEKIQEAPFQYRSGEGLQTVMAVGVNGSGKTTTVGKLAYRLAQEGASVVVGACDTFRPAAVQQLGQWCKRASVRMVEGKEGSRPSGVGYRALETALKDRADYCLLDTAGRFHTAENLMKELVKCRDVLKKLDEKAPQHIILTIDAATGQNSLRQAQEFHGHLGLTGLVLTKYDGPSKAGSIVGIVDSLKVPVNFLGTGESIGDLRPFSSDDYLKALFSRS